MMEVNRQRQMIGIDIQIDRRYSDGGKWVEIENRYRQIDRSCNDRSKQVEIDG